MLLLYCFVIGSLLHYAVHGISAITCVWIMITSVYLFNGHTMTMYTSASSVWHTRFVICSSYWEQQTNAVLNLWSLQKWADITRFRVVQPYASQSTLGLTNKMLENYNFTNALSFRDYFDLDHWTNMTNKYGISPMASWETFYVYSFRKIVVVIIVYEVSIIGLYKDSDINKHSDCVKEKETFYDKHAKLFDKLGVQVVRNVCYAFNFKVDFNDIELDQFNSYLLLNDSISVWFSCWRGINYDRIPISDHEVIKREYGGEEKVLAMIKPSSRILADSRKFVNTVLHSDFSEYTAVAFRTAGRRNALINHGFSRNNVIRYFHMCTKKISYAVMRYAMYKFSNNFLSIDLGKFGDLTADRYFNVKQTGEYDGAGTQLFESLLQIVYGHKSIDEYHNELIRAANGIEDSGYIGSMQKTIAKNAKHLIVVGGKSSFQRSMVLNFRTKTQKCKDCIVSFICYK